MKEITLFNSKKAVTMMFAAFLISASIAFVVPFLAGKSQASFVVAALVFFALPLMSGTYIKRICMKHGTITFTPDCIKIIVQDNIQQKLDWNNLKNIQFNAFRNMAGRGIHIILRTTHGENLKYAFIENVADFIEGAEQESVLSEFLHFVKLHNASVLPPSQIKITPSFLASSSGAFLLLLPVGLIVLDICLRLSHTVQIKNHFLSFYVAIMLLFGLLAQRNKERRLYNLILKRLHATT